MKWNQLRTIIGLIREPRLRAVHDLEARGGYSSLKDRYWTSRSAQPRFEIAERPPLPGWNMVELEIHTDAKNASAHFEIEARFSGSIRRTFRLPIKHGAISKRLIFVPWGAKSLHFQPVDTRCNFELRALRFVWVTPRFAQARIARRLSTYFSEYRELDRRAVIRKIHSDAALDSTSRRTRILERYEASFRRTSTSEDYLHWIRRCERPAIAAKGSAVAHGSKLKISPRISILLPVYDTPLPLLSACLDSVRRQIYQNWELIIVDDASNSSGLSTLLRAAQHEDRRIKVIEHAENRGVAATSNTALQSATGAYIALLDHDDQLAEHALLRVAEIIEQRPEAVLVYSDEDKIDDDGRRHDPHFKPDWNPDLLLAQNYVSHLGVYQRERVVEVGGFREGFEGSQDHDLVLRVTAGLAPERIVHIPEILYHWRATAGSTAQSPDEKPRSTAAGVRATDAAIKALNAGAYTSIGLRPNTYRAHWPLPAPPPTVSIIVPTRDGYEVLSRCIDSVLERTTYPAFELVIVDNGSTCVRTLDYLSTIGMDSRVRVLEWDSPFNFSAINNFAVRQADGELLCLLNNDTEVITPAWLEEMAAQASRPEIGCVGAKLYYPDDTIQHAGVVLGIGGVAGHGHKFQRRNDDGYFGRLRLAHNVSAVTAACLVVRKEIYEKVGGMNETHLPVAFNDVDLCLRVRAAGYRNLWTPFAELYHHESISRGADSTPEKQQRAAREVRYMHETWGDALQSDPAYNPNLTLLFEDFSLR